MLPFRIMLMDGDWPANHEMLAWKNRIVLYAQHFYQWDFIPLWSTGDAHGLGAPMPAYYHKLFYWITAPFFIVFHSTKEAALFGLVSFSAIGVAGLYKTIRKFGLSDWASLFIASTYLFQNYTITDWYFRGAMAEFSALMLVPWLIWWCIRFIETDKFSFIIVPISLLIFYAHNVIAYYSMFALLICLTVVMLKNKFSLSLLKSYLKKASLSILLFLLGISISIIPIFLFRNYYNPNKILLDISHSFRPLKSYFIEYEYIWHNPDSYTVQLAFSLTLFVVIFLILHILNKFAALKTILNHKPAFTWIILFLTSSFLFYLILQSGRFIWFYQLLPGGVFIQFVWRLLTFIQPLLILLLAFLIATYFKSTETKLIHWVCGLFLFASICSYPLLKRPPNTLGWIPQSEVEKVTNGGMFGIGEYMPNVKGIKTNDADFFNRLSQRGLEIITKGNARGQKMLDSIPESLIQEYHITCDTSCEVILPINLSGLEKVSLVSQTQKPTSIPIAFHRTSTDPRIRITVPAGKHQIRVILPSFLSFMGLMD